MGNNDLRILITGTLNVGRSIQEINTAIRGIQKRINSLKLNVQINDRTAKTLNDFSKAMEKMQVTQQNLQRSYKEEETVIKKLDGSTEKVTRQYLKSGEIIEKTKKIIDEKTKATEKEAQATGRLASELDNLGRVQQRITKQDGKGNITGQTEKHRNGYVDTIVNTDKDGRVTSTRIIENLNKETDATRKLIQSKNELRQKHQELIQMGQMSSRQSLNMQRMIETSSNQTHIKKATDEYNRLLKTSNELLKVEQARQTVSRGRDKERQIERQKTAELEKRIRLYKQEAVIRARNLRSTYAHSGGVDEQALNQWLSGVRQINATSPKASDQLRQMDMQFKRINASAKESASSIGHHNMSVLEMARTAMVNILPSNMATY